MVIFLSKSDNLIIWNISIMTIIDNAINATSIISQFSAKKR